MKKIILIIIVLAVAIILIGKWYRKDDTTSYTVKSKPAVVVDVAEVKEEVPDSWVYTDREDKMNSTTTYIARVNAKELMQFDFPYHGGTESSIMVRKNASGTDVMLIISQGQFITSFTGDQYIKAKFGENKPKNYSISRSSDGSTEVVFINNDKNFIANLKANNTVIIEAEFYQEGIRQMEFNIQNFEWNH